MSEAKTYSGGCHCGRVRYEVKTALQPVVSCNCSICSKRGSLLTFVPFEDFAYTKGSDEDLTVYQFNKHVINHMFCLVCGILPFAKGKRPDGKQMVAVNVRCLDGIRNDAQLRCSDAHRSSVALVESERHQTSRRRASTKLAHRIEDFSRETRRDREPPPPGFS